MAPFDRMVIAGVGLIGGSLGLVARARHLAREVVGFGRGEANLQVALERGAIDRFATAAPEAAAGADLLVLAVPVGAMRAVAEVLLPHAQPDAILIDAGSVKESVVTALEAVVRPPARFVGCHPIAGTELSGAAAALDDLFTGSLCVLTPTPATDAAALARVRALWEAVGMRVETMTPGAHDRLLALVSHLPHVVAYGLIAAIEDVRVEERDPLAYSGGGLRDTTRIASSHPEMWRDICLDNRDQILRALDGFTAAVGRLRGLIESNDGAGLERELARLRSARGRLRERLPKEPG